MDIKLCVELRLDLKILAIDSSYDKITQRSCEYRNRNVYPYMESKGVEIVRCQDQSACRSYVKSKLSQNNIIYITGVGHGTDTAYLGEDSKPIFDVDKYQHKELQNKIVHLFACHTAAELGPNLVKHGCLAFFGYDVECIVYLHISDAFFECASEIDRAFADGLTAEQVYERTIEYYNRKISELIDGGHYEEAAALEYNREHLCAPSVNSKWEIKMQESDSIQSNGLYFSLYLLR